jgi:hypothetical protein
VARLLVIACSKVSSGLTMGRKREEREGEKRRGFAYVPLMQRLIASICSVGPTQWSWYDQAHAIHVLNRSVDIYRFDNPCIEAGS